MENIQIKLIKFNEKHLEIYRKIKEGIPTKKITEEYGITRQSVSTIVKNCKNFYNYCTEMEELKSKGISSDETMLYDLAKMLQFDSRCINALMNRQIYSIDKLFLLDEYDIYAIKRLGEHSREHMYKCIDKYKKENKIVGGPIRKEI